MRTIIALSVAFVLLLTGGALADEPGEMQAGGKGALSTEPEEAEARSAPGAIEEIMVTARKREEGGQSVPISISAFTGAELDAAQMRNLYTVAELTPNLEIRKVYVQARPAIYIRGVGTSDFGSEVASSVGIYKDGVYMALQPGIMFQTFDMDRTEVLRGPQGTLYGKNTTGGAINLHSKLPSDEFEAYGQVTYGNYKTFNFEGAVNIPLSERTALRLSGARRDTDGWMDNHGPGHDKFFVEDNWGVRALLSHQATENLDLLFNFHAGRIKGPWVYAQRGLFDPATVDGRSFNFIDPATRTPANPQGEFKAEGNFACPTNIFDNQCADATGHVFGGSDRLHDAQSPEPVDEEINLWGTSITANYDMDTRWGPITLTSITALERVDSTEWEDLDAGPEWLYNYRADDRSHQFTQELRATSAGDSRLQWLAGAWYFQSNIKTRSDAYTPPDGSQGGDFGFWTQSSNGDKFLTENYAFFGEASYELTERLKFTGGLRYSWERKQSRQYAYQYFGYGPCDGVTETPLCSLFAGVIPAPDVAVAQGTPCGTSPEAQDPANCGPGRDESDSWKAISGKAVLDYQLTDDVMVYASYKRGFKSGGFSSSLTNGARAARDPATFGAHILDTTVDEEILQAYEAGFKSMWFDRRLRFNFSTFFYDYDDLQVFALTSVGGQVVSILENAADATIWGGEIDMFARPLPGLELRVAAAWLSTEYKDYQTVQDVSVGATDFSGNEMIAAPNYSGSASLAYELNVMDGVARAQISTSYSDEVHYKADNIDRARQGSVWLVNGNFSYRLPDDRTEISLWIRNWNDKVYITNVFDIFDFGLDQLGSSRPRMYGVTVRYDF